MALVMLGMMSRWILKSHRSLDILIHGIKKATPVAPLKLINKYNINSRKNQEGSQKNWQEEEVVQHIEPLPLLAIVVFLVGFMVPDGVCLAERLLPI
jgi:hypothetical protein